MPNDAQRERILEAALEKFRKFGIRRVTMDEIARDLRVSKKTLYQYFPDKEALVRACTVKIQDSLIPMIAEAIDRDGPPINRILDAWKVLARIPHFLSAEFIADIKADYPHIWNEVDVRRHEVISRFEKLIEDGVRTGDIRREIHPRVAMRIIFAVIDQVMVPDVLALAEFTPAEAINTLVTMFSKGMCATTPEPPAAEVVR